MMRSSIFAALSCAFSEDLAASSAACMARARCGSERISRTPPGGPRYERLVFDAAGQLIVPLNEWYRLMQGVGATRTRDTYLAVLRPWFGFLARHGHPWNARPDAVREYTRLFLLEAGCA